MRASRMAGTIQPRFSARKSALLAPSPLAPVMLPLLLVVVVVVVVPLLLGNGTGHGWNGTGGV